MVTCWLALGLLGGATGGFFAPVEGQSLPETMTEENVAAFLEDQGITTVEAFIDALPPLHKAHFVAIHSSWGPASDFISPAEPRIVSWGADSRFVVSWTTNRDHAESNQISFLQPAADEGRWIAGVIDFSAESPEIRHPTTCARCHSSLNRPLWGPEFHNLGTEEESQNESFREFSDDVVALYATMRGTTDPRLAPLDRSDYLPDRKRAILMPNGKGTSPVWELAGSLLLRHAEVLFRQLRDSPDYDSFVASTICLAEPGFLEAIGHRFPQVHQNLRLLSDTGEPIQGEDELADREPLNYIAAGIDLHRAIAFLVYRDAWSRFEEARAFYSGTSNEEMLGATGSFEESLLRFPPGEATAEEELEAALAGFFDLQGRSFLEEMVLRNGLVRWNRTFIGAHVGAFRSRLCTALTGAGPEEGGFDADEAGDADDGGGAGGGGGGGGGGGAPPSEDGDNAGDTGNGGGGGSDGSDSGGGGGGETPPGAAIAADAECVDDVCRARTGVPVRFEDTSSGTVSTRLWEFGEGTTSRRQSVEHAWSEPGFYEVTLRTSNGTDESTTSLTFLVEAAEPAGTCVPDERTRCLRDSRYAVSVDWRGLNDGGGNANVVHEGTDDSGMFHFFDPDNWEVLIKVLDGCALNGHMWVFGASTTDLGYLIRVTDTVTGTVREYRNEPGTPAPAITDATAFPNGCRTEPADFRPP